MSGMSSRLTVHANDEVYNTTRERMAMVEEESKKSWYVVMLTRHAANECGGWVKIVIRFRLSHNSRGLASVKRVTV